MHIEKQFYVKKESTKDLKINPEVTVVALDELGSRSNS